MRLTTIALSVAALGLTLVPLFSQVYTGPKPSVEIVNKPSFETASIRLSTNSGALSGFSGEPGGTRMTMASVTVRQVLAFAYRLREFQIVDGPDWTNTVRFDIEAKAEGRIPFPTAPQGLPTNGWELRTQSLLEDRFQLRMHRDTRELPVYELVQAPGGAKLKLSADQTGVGGNLRIQRTADGWKLQAKNVILPRLIGAIEQRVDRFILNKAAFPNGTYDVDLQWVDDGPTSSGPSIFTALEEQLGLHLVAATGRVEVIVIDSVQKPAVN